MLIESSTKQSPLQTKEGIVKDLIADYLYEVLRALSILEETKDGN